MRISTLFTSLLALTACGKSRESVPAENASIDAKTSHLVPPFQAVTWEISTDPRPPLIDNESVVMQTIEYLLEYEGDPRLQTPDDLKEMRLLHEYYRRERPLHIIIAAASDADGQTGRAAYACRSDLYALMPGLRSTKQMFSLVLYHEVQHAVRCASKLSELGISRDQADEYITTDPCEAEPPAFAASARLMQAMIDHGRQPKIFSSIDEYDLASINVLYAAWSALSHDKFCSWYRGMWFATPPAATP
jgi:hypothetical protein